MTKYSNFSTDYKKSKGRIYPEEIDPHRNCFMRDRDRIIHSSAFRRLKYKTQVFVYHHEDGSTGSLDFREMAPQKAFKKSLKSL